jgi:flagellar export protein FliJ
MAKFTFNLDPLLKIRAQAEQAAQRALATFVQQQVALEDRLRQQQHMLMSSSHDMRSRLVGELNVSELRQHASAALLGARDANHIVLELASVLKSIETARGRLLEARQKRLAIERVRERRYQDWQAKLNKAEHDLLDEIASRPHTNDLAEFTS